MIARATQVVRLPSTGVSDCETLRNVFQSIDATSCPKHYNFHLHTVYSDGQLTPEKLIEQALQNGLKGLAITDHHQVGGYYAAQEWLARYSANHYRPEEDRLKLWTGVEINAHLLDGEVHVLGYAFDPMAESMKPYLQGSRVKGDAYLASQVVEAIHRAGGLAVLAHPARYRQSPESLIPAAAMLEFDGVEAYYAYDNPKQWRPSPEPTRRILDLCEGRDLLRTCGTDTHGHNILRRVGR